MSTVILASPRYLVPERGLERLLYLHFNDSMKAESQVPDIKRVLFSLFECIMTVGASLFESIINCSISGAKLHTGNDDGPACSFGYGHF